MRPRRGRQSRRLSVYRSLTPRSTIIPSRMTGTVSFTCGSDGHSAVAQLHAKQAEMDQYHTLFNFFEKYRVVGIKYEFKRFSNVGFDLTGGGTIDPMKMATTGFNLADTGLVATNNAVPTPNAITGSLSPVAGAVTIDKAPSGLKMGTSFHAGTPALPTLYWCKPQAPGIVPTSTRMMIEKWPKVSKFEFGARRVLKLTVPPVVYQRTEYAYNLINSTNSNFGYHHAGIRARRSPWWTTNGTTESGPVEENTYDINHGLTYMGCRGAPGKYTFEVTKTVLIEYKGHVITQPAGLFVDLSAPTGPQNPRGRLPGAVEP